MTEKRFSHKDKSLYIDDDYFCELEDGDEITELLNRQQYTVETVWKENEQLKKELFESEKDYIMETYSDNPIRRDEKIQSLKEEFKARFGDVE